MKRVLFAAFVAASSFAIPSAQAQPAWMNYSAQRICAYLERGFSPYKAGYQGMKDVVDSRYAGAVLRAYRQHGEEKASVMAATAAMQRCPSALIESTRNTGI